MRVEQKKLLYRSFGSENKKSKSFFFFYLEVGKKKLTTKKEADAFKRTSHVLLNSIWALDFFLSKLFAGTLVFPDKPFLSYMKILIFMLKVLRRKN